jgi:hypothetical protein
MKHRRGIKLNVKWLIHILLLFLLLYLLLYILNQLHSIQAYIKYNDQQTQHIHKQLDGLRQDDTRLSRAFTQHEYRLDAIQSQNVKTVTIVEQPIHKEAQPEIDKPTLNHPTVWIASVLSVLKTVGDFVLSPRLN